LISDEDESFSSRVCIAAASGPLRFEGDDNMEGAGETCRSITRLRTVIILKPLIHESKPSFCSSCKDIECMGICVNVFMQAKRKTTGRPERSFCVDYYYCLSSDVLRMKTRKFEFQINYLNDPHNKEVITGNNFNVIHAVLL
jgi:hypothetical protein